MRYQCFMKNAEEKYLETIPLKGKCKLSLMGECSEKEMRRGELSENIREECWNSYREGSRKNYLSEVSQAV